MRVFIIIVAMSVVTMLPRLLPVWIVDKWRFPEWIGRFLEAVPYAALGALIFPGIITVVENRPEMGLIGGFVAVFLALKSRYTIVVILGAVLVVYWLIWINSCRLDMDVSVRNIVLNI
nr:AzlD domain-containing protein [Pelagirhabdus alkalitolerans]